MTDLAFHVRQFVPECSDPAEMEQRQALLKARDFAAALRGRSESIAAVNHAADAHECAGAFVFADVPVQSLELAVKYCRHLVQAAFIADHLDWEARQ